MPWEGRITGWDIFKSSIERGDPNFSCTKSSAVNGSIMAVVGAAVGFVISNSVVRGCLGGSAVSFTVGFTGSQLPNQPLGTKMFTFSLIQTTSDVSTARIS